MSDEAQSAARPATFREVFSGREYRAVFSATALSWLGDYIARAAITVIVFQQTESVALSAAAFAISYLPWLIGGPLLATVADRYPYRTVMVVCDLLRAGLISLVALPFMPVWAMLSLLFLTTLATPPAQAARSALMPLILAGDRLVVGLSINNSTSQAAQVIGYSTGAGLAAFSPRSAIVLDAVTFFASAALIRFGVRQRPAALARAARTHLVRETAEGFRLVFGTTVLRSIAIIVLSAGMFAIVPEGLAAAWAQQSGGSDGRQGLYQALIMAAGPIGLVIGGLTMTRLVPPRTRRKLVRIFAVLAPLVLVPALLNPPPPVVALLAGLCGVAAAGLLPVTNGLFVQALPHAFRARANGVMATGMQLVQGGAVLVTGLLAQHSTIPRVVGWWSIAGVLLMLVVSASWPSGEQIDDAIAAAARTLPPELRAQGSPVAAAVAPVPPQAGTAAAKSGAGPARGPAAPSELGSRPAPVRS